jgi:hypothetical protein
LVQAGTKPPEIGKQRPLNLQALQDPGGLSDAGQLIFPKKKLPKAGLYAPVVRATSSSMLVHKSRNQKLVEACRHPINVPVRKHSVQIPASFSIVAAQEVFQEARALARWGVTRPNCSFFCMIQEDELAPDKDMHHAETQLWVFLLVLFEKRLPTISIDGMSVKMSAAGRGSYTVKLGLKNETTMNALT